MLFRTTKTPPLPWMSTKATRAPDARPYISLHALATTLKRAMLALLA